MAIPRVGKRGVEEETVNLEDIGLEKTDNFENLTVSAEEDLEKRIGDARLDELIKTYKYQLFLKTNKFLLFRI